MTDTITPTPTAETVRVAALISAIELLISPEFGDAFIREMSEAAGVTPTNENIEAVTAEVMVINTALAAPLIAQLPPSLQADYR